MLAKVTSFALIGLDSTLVDDPYLVFQAGRHDQAIRINVEDYQSLVHPRILDFSYHLH